MRSHTGHWGSNSQRERVTALKLFAAVAGRGSELNRTFRAAWHSVVVEGLLSYREINQPSWRGRESPPGYLRWYRGRPGVTWDGVREGSMSGGNSRIEGGDTARCLGSYVSELLLLQLSESTSHDSCCVVLEENKGTCVGKSACIGSSVLGERCQNSPRKWGRRGNGENNCTWSGL